MLKTQAAAKSGGQHPQNGKYYSMNNCELILAYFRIWTSIAKNKIIHIKMSYIKTISEASCRTSI